MRKLLSALLLLLLCATPALAAGTSSETAPAPAKSRIEQLTGSVWMNTTQEGKLGVLFGMELAMNIDKAIADHFAQKAAKAQSDNKTGKKAGKSVPAFRLSPFTLAWYEAFKDTRLTDIAAQIDSWYAAHPDQGSRLVLDVIWVELMKKPQPKAQ